MNHEAISGGSVAGSHRSSLCSTSGILGYNLRRLFLELSVSASALAAAGDRNLLAIITNETSVVPIIADALNTTFNVIHVESNSQLDSLLERAELDGLLIDLDGVGDGTEDGIKLLTEVRSLRDDLLLVALSRSKLRNLHIRALQAGADDFFLAPLECDHLQAILARSLERRRLETEGRRMKEQIERRQAFCELIGSSEAMQQVYQAIQCVADSSSPVMIRGESGTGKELVARAVVQCSRRCDRPLISLNCAALPESLIESELFGHERGAFTGADSARPGQIELADGGTLFLDEIGALDVALQSKLLRVLQERTVQRLGGKSTRKIDFRLITATNEDLEQRVQKGEFREDLYYRINVVPILLPRLQDRTGDLPLLVDHFLRIYCAANGKPLKAIESDALEIFEDYPWPGNIRELENVIQRLVLTVDAPVISAKHLPHNLLCSSTSTREALLIPEKGIDFDGEMERIQLAYLQAALRRTGGKKVAAAALLHIDQQRMKYLCRKNHL